MALDRTALRRRLELGIEGADAFDATKSLNTYAQGAWGSISGALDRQLQDLESASGNAGRFNSGLYDQDTGVIVEQGRRDLANSIAQQAPAAARLQMDANNEQYDRTSDLYTLDENDYRDAEERKRRSRAGIGEAIGGVLGAGAGFLAGGPGGVAAGAKLGSGLGGAVATRF